MQAHGRLPCIPSYCWRSCRPGRCRPSRAPRLWRGRAETVRARDHSRTRPQYGRRPAANSRSCTPCALPCPDESRGPAVSGSSPGPSGRRHGPNADSGVRRNCAGECVCLACDRRPLPKLRARECTPAILSRAVPPCASYSDTGPLAWCRRSALSSCLARPRYPSRLRCRPQPLRCGLCPAETWSQPRRSRPSKRPRWRLAAPRRPLRSPARHRNASGIRASENSPVLPNSHRAEADIDIAECHGKEAHPGPALMARVQTAYAFIGAEAERREQVETAAYQVPERVTPKRIAAEQDYVGSQNERSQPDPERSPTGHRVGEPERFPDIEDEARQEQERQVEKIAMNVLENQGKPPLAAVCIARL